MRLRTCSSENRRGRWCGLPVFQWAVLAGAMLGLCPAAEARAATDSQTLSEYQVKAGFLFNFTRFVEWPQRDFAGAGSPLQVCIVGETPMAGLLTEVAAGRVVNGRTVSVRRMRPAQDFRGCNLLFVGASEGRRVARILAAVKGMDVLAVGESRGFVEAGGVINFVVQDSQVKLELNMDAAARAHLKISAKLIAASHVVSLPQKPGRN